MRKIIAAIILFSLGIIVPSILERHMKNAPEWVWQWLQVGFITGAIILALLSDLIYLKLKNAHENPIFSTAIISLAGAFIIGAIWWFVVVPQQERVKESKSESSLLPPQLKTPTAQEIAEEVAKKTQRAWITLEGMHIIEPLTISKEGARIALSIVIKNHGSVPGTNIMIIPQMAAIAIKDGLNLEAALHKALQISKNWEKHRDRVGSVLPPAKSLIQNYVVEIPYSEIVFAAQGGDDHDRFIASISGCIDYSFSGGTGQTTFNYVLIEKDSTHMGINIAPHVVAIEKLILQDEPFGVYAK